MNGAPEDSERLDKEAKGSSTMEEQLASSFHFRDVIETIILYVGLPAATLYPIGTLLYLSELFFFYGKSPFINADFNSVAYAVILIPDVYIMLQAFASVTWGGYPFLAVLVPAIFLSFLFYARREDWRRFWDISRRRHDTRWLLIAVAIVSLIVGSAYTIWISGRLGTGGRFAAILMPLLLASLLLTLSLWDTRQRQRSSKQIGRQGSSILRSPVLVTITVILAAVVLFLGVVFAFAVLLVLSPQRNGDTSVGVGLIAIYVVFLGGVLSGAKMGKDLKRSELVYALKRISIPRRRWIFRGLIIAYLVYSITNATLAGTVTPPQLPVAEFDTNDTASLLGTASPYVLQNNTTYWFFLTNDGDIVALTNEQVGDLRVKW